MVGAGRIAGRRADAAILLLDQRLVGELLALGIAPQGCADMEVEPLGEGLGEAVGERLEQDVLIIVGFGLEAGKMFGRCRGPRSPRSRRSSRRPAR
jgi:hypothetical protein